MRNSLIYVTAALAMSCITSAQAASLANCSVTHHECYPACVQMNSDGSDCAKTRNVCRDVCGPEPSYPARESMNANRFEAPDATVLPSQPDRDPMAEPLAPGDSITPPNP